MNILKKLSIFAVLSITLGGCSVFHGSPDLGDLIEQTKKGVVIVSATGIKDLRTDAAPDGEGNSLGTGFFIEENLIVTNTHVIYDADTVMVGLENSIKPYEAEVVHSDKVADIALLKIKDIETFKTDNDYHILEFSDDYEAGELSFAIGHPYGYDYTVTKGNISYVGRQIDPSPRFMVQTDVQILQGNSGGPLLNEHGNVIGVNDIIMPVMGGTFSFAIDQSIVQKVIRDFENYNEVRWPFVGIHIQNNEITSVLDNSPAQTAGLQAGDRIISMRINDKDIEVKKATDVTKSLAVSDYQSDVFITVIDKEGDEIEFAVVPSFKQSDFFWPQVVESLNKGIE